MLDLILELVHVEVRCVDHPGGHLPDVLPEVPAHPQDLPWDHGGQKGGFILRDVGPDGDRARIIVGDAEAIEAPEESFDAVVEYGIETVAPERQVSSLALYEVGL